MNTDTIRRILESFEVVDSHAKIVSVKDDDFVGIEYHVNPTNFGYMSIPILAVSPSDLIKNGVTGTLYRSSVSGVSYYFEIDRAF